MVLSSHLQQYIGQLLERDESMLVPRRVVQGIGVSDLSCKQLLGVLIKMLINVMHRLLGWICLHSRAVLFL